jgi:hypothetical protein
MKIHTLTCALGLLLAAGAQAQIETTIGPSTRNWSATAGETVGTANNVAQAEAGWPGFNITYLRGLDSITDVGLKIGFNYSFEGTSNTTAGFNLAVPFRRTVARQGNIVVSARVEPGVTFYDNQGTLFGVGGPIGVVAGFRVDPFLVLTAGADVPVLLSFTHPFGLAFGPQVGVGGEYQIDRDVALTARFRVGPEFAITSRGTGSDATFLALLGLAYNMR